MRIATWNINSVRLRAPLFAELEKQAAPDIVCLQETKVIDELFPHDALSDLYPHRHMPVSYTHLTLPTIYSV